MPLQAAPLTHVGYFPCVGFSTRARPLTSPTPSRDPPPPYSAGSALPLPAIGFRSLVFLFPGQLFSRAYLSVFNIELGKLSRKYTIKNACVPRSKNEDENRRMERIETWLILRIGLGLKTCVTRVSAYLLFQQTCIELADIAPMLQRHHILLANFPFCRFHTSVMILSFGRLI